ncbi:STAS domain-containing protein [Actinokineospora diospyrosa]|uniref:Anti-anti-sigma factor n=1 Tax=Actinokineospora diospyrosa TaxID=103728 RepID=A0ABT1IEW8_9PSEU|nr:STAS domain-containing protein [Actinokineospora diospyrosa]MCP2271177.1 anti-anti-sigma factor [Actinokineospora diospyrosa]
MERRADGRVVLVRVEGELDLSTVGVLAAGLDEGLAEATASGVSLLVVDLGATTFLGSVAMTRLIVARDDAAALGVDLGVVASPGGIVARALEVAGMNQVFPIERTLDWLLRVLPRPRS